MPSKTLSPTAKAVLTAAAANPDLLIELPDRLPAAARRAVVQAMLKTGWAEEITAPAGQPGWRTVESGEPVGLRATPAGLALVGVTPATPAPPLSSRVGLRAAAAAVLAAWDDPAGERPALAGSVDVLRAALAPTRAASRTTGLPRTPRTGTKQEAVLTLLRRPEGASVAQVAEATGWAAHTVRGFFAGLNKKGISVAVLERVRQVGSGKQGARGSYTIYHVVEAG